MTEKWNENQDINDEEANLVASIPQVVSCPVAYLLVLLQGLGPYSSFDLVHLKAALVLVQKMEPLKTLVPY